MANVQTSITQVTFKILDQTTECYIRYESSEPDNPFWGGQDIKHKSFEKERSIFSIVPEIVDYLEWDSICPTCLQPKFPNNAYCVDAYHIDPLDELRKHLPPGLI